MILIVLDYRDFTGMTSKLLSVYLRWSRICRLEPMPPVLSFGGVYRADTVSLSLPGLKASLCSVYVANFSFINKPKVSRGELHWVSTHKYDEAE